METVKGFCPACRIEVDYEADEELDGQLFCPECGRTREMAEKARKIAVTVSRRNTVKKYFRIVGYTLAFTFFIGSLLLFFIYDAEEGSIVYDAVVAGATGGIMIVIIRMVMSIRAKIKSIRAKK